MPIWNKIYVIIDCYLLSIICVNPCVNNFQQSTSSYGMLLFTRPPNQWNVHWARSLCMLGKTPFALCVHNRIHIDVRHFRSLKPVLAFQTLTPATLGKWATTHEKHFVLGKNCSWTLLPGSTWLQTRITWVYPRSNIKAHFGSLKRAGDLRVYQGFMMPLTHQAGRHARYFKTRLKILVDRALRQHALFPFDARSIHVLCFTSQ